LSMLLRRSKESGVAVPVRVAVGILVDVLQGLGAAHAACDENGQALGIVHRDVSPQNVLVGADGVSRLVDFGVSKAAGRLQTTRDGQVKVKCAYMSPEQLRGREVDARTDVYAAALVLWETLTGRRLFMADSPEGTMTLVL